MYKTQHPEGSVMPVLYIGRTVLKRLKPGYPEYKDSVYVLFLYTYYRWRMWRDLKGNSWQRSAV